MAINHFSTVELGEEVLAKANPEERLALTKALDPKADRSLEPRLLADLVCRNGGHGVANFFRGQGVPYSEVLGDTANILKIAGTPSISTVTNQGVSLAEIDARALVEWLDPIVHITWRTHLDNFILDTEKAILSKVAVDIYSQLSQTQKGIVDKKVQEMAQIIPGKNLSGIGTASALVALGNLGGFATYTLMSSIISSLTFGTVGFGAYTFASSALSLALGPPGIALLGGAALYKFAGPDDRRSLLAICTIGMIRQRLIGERALSYYPAPSSLE